MNTRTAGRAIPPAAVADPLEHNAYVESGTVYFWDETGSFSAESERRYPRHVTHTRRHR